MHRLAVLLLLFVAAGGGHAAWAQQAASSSSDFRRSGAVLADMDTGTFIDAHPDLHFRHLGMAAYHDGHKREAFDYFLIASRYADKASQAIVALMYWTGDGAPHDRPLAYAWMELAASRGYPELQHQCDLYWAQLNDEERGQARDQRQALEAGYGDDAGARRLTRELGSIRSQVTGSHLGWVGYGVVIQADSAGRAAGGESVAGLLRGAAVSRDMSSISDSVRLNTAQYLQMKDLQWQIRMSKGRVEVGDPESIRPPAG
ncbi:sel1 repeat family protein [Dyella sp. EPa41]|uniref:sel1 repeat family protein n=1 Tax=Dyella sp. EPa41 TaxID=1561194 RepID=UPI001914F673|nr:sel1 repeat family protein [Dyella sp. EPa41]